MTDGLGAQILKFRRAEAVEIDKVQMDFLYHVHDNSVYSVQCTVNSKCTMHSAQGTVSVQGTVSPFFDFFRTAGRRRLQMKWS